MKTLGDRLRKARTDAELTLREVGEKCGGKTPQAVGQWEKNETIPSARDLGIVAVLTGVSLNWLIYGGDSAAFNNISSTKASVGRIVPSVEWTKLEQFFAGDQAAAAGAARSHFPCGSNSFQTFVVDRANEPEMGPGDSIIVDPDLPPTPGQYCLAVVDGTYMIRRLRVRAKRIELVPNNDSWDVVEAPSAAESIIGPVTEHSRRMI